MNMIETSDIVVFDLFFPFHIHWKKEGGQIK